MPDQNSRYYGAAADYNKPGGVNLLPRILLLVGGLVLFFILIAVVFQVIGSISSGPQRELEQLVAREQALASFTAEYQSSITDSALAKTNSETTILAKSDTAALLKSLNLTEVPKESVETDSTSKAKLDTARQTGNFNSEYSIILQTKIAAAMQLASSAAEKTSKKDLKATLQQLVVNLLAAQAQL